MKENKDPLIWIDAIALITLIIGIIILFSVDKSLGVSIGAIPLVWLAFRYFSLAIFS